MASHLKVSPVKVSATGFFDGAAHRQALPPTYNQYRKMTAELGFDPAEDDAVIVFRPLFMTAFLIDDFLARTGSSGPARAAVQRIEQDGVRDGVPAACAGRSRSRGIDLGGQQASWKGWDATTES
jgi:hypothetical protein